MKIKDLKEDDIIHCPTKEEAEKVLEICHYSGMKWKDNIFYTKLNPWDHYKEKTFFAVKEGTYGNVDNFHDYMEKHPEENTKCVSAEDFILDNILDLPNLKENYKEPEKIIFKDKQWLYCEGSHYPFIIKYKSGGNGDRFEFYEQYGINKVIPLFGELDEKFNSSADDMYKNHATEEQLTKILGKVAKLKGYKVGKEITVPSNASNKANEEVTILNKERVYNMETDELSLGGLIVYADGVWAELKYPAKKKRVASSIRELNHEQLVQLLRTISK